ncbi:MAG: UDP-N-acetylglucosamine--N-acetylmuramyl-(pentapeptide) pyrophosphoryl-undecaprenol N-acetylglucosamine transferase [Candidatus Magasanikbacteria bacterium]|nr:UDP-N-acetylglucosamine--N-acetylmuramyl-(pentapeptide) pyrophosphoryl-undecaprenol N-acetylglucosamine transferase [Candidatus Magasanikbacteria bacterium]
MKEETKRIIFSGGGTLGPVMPLVAVLQELRVRYSAWEFLWVGTTTGPEREVLERVGVRFVALPPAKWRKYKSLKNITDLAVLSYDIFKSWKIIKHFQPDILITAGGYVSVPLHIAGRIARIPMLVHQEDVVPGLANRIMARFATLVTVTFERSAPYFKNRRVVCIGNPVRAGLQTVRRAESLAHFSFSSARKTLLVIGGGTGATRLNHLVAEALPILGKKYQVLHVTGRGKAYWGSSQDMRHKAIVAHYRYFEFLDERELGLAFAAADIVVTRAGLGTLSELAVLGKPAMIVPIKHSHQEENAAVFAGRGAAILFEETVSYEDFARAAQEMLDDDRELALMAHNMKKIMPSNAREAFAVAVEELIK